MSIVLEGTDLSIFSKSDTRNIYQALPIEKTGHTVGNILMMHLSLQTFPSLKRKPEFFVSYRSSTWSADREKKHQMYSTTCSYKNSICHQEVPSSIQDHLVPPLGFFRFQGFQTPPQFFFSKVIRSHIFWSHYRYMGDWLRCFIWGCSVHFGISPVLFPLILRDLLFAKCFSKSSMFFLIISRCCWTVMSRPPALRFVATDLGFRNLSD